MIKFFESRKYSILKIVSRYMFVFVLGVSILFPIFVVNAVGGTSGVTVQTTIDNPLGSELDTIPAFIAKLLTIVLEVGVPLVALSIIYSGFLFVSARGSSEKLKTAKNALLYSVIGAALLLGAWVLAEAIQATVDDIKSTT